MNRISIIAFWAFLCCFASCNQEKTISDSMHEYDVLTDDPLTFADSLKKYYVYILAYNTNMAFTVDTMPPDYDAKATLQIKHDAADQEFMTVMNPDMSFSFVNRKNGMALTSLGSLSGGIVVQQTANFPAKQDQSVQLIPFPNKDNPQFFSFGYRYPQSPPNGLYDTAYYQITSNQAGGFIYLGKKSLSTNLLFKIAFSTNEIRREKRHTYNPVLPHINYALTVRNSGLVIAATGGQGSVGANTIVTQETANPSNAFAWQFIPDYGNPGFYNIINYANGLYLDVQNGLKVQGANLVQNPPNNNSSQLFSIDSNGIGKGYWRIMNKNSGLYVTIADTSTAAGAIAILATYTGGTKQNFLLEAIPYDRAPLATDELVFMCSASQKIMQNTLTGAFLTGSTGTNLQRFGVFPIAPGSDTVGITAVNDGPNALTTNGQTTAGSPVIMQDYNSFTASYQWKIEAVGNGMYRIKSMQSNLYVTESTNGYTQEALQQDAFNQQFAIIPVRPMNLLISNINCYHALHNSVGDDLFYHTWGDTEPGKRVPNGENDFHKPAMFAGDNWIPSAIDNNRNFLNNMNFELWQYSTLGNNQPFPTISVGNGSTSYFMPGTWNASICLDNNNCDNCQYIISFSILGR